MEYYIDGIKILPLKYYYSNEGLIVLEYQDVINGGTLNKKFNDNTINEMLSLFIPKKTINILKKNIKQETINIYKMAEVTENNLKTLRSHLFEAIRKLEGGAMKSEEAKSMAQLAQTIINSAKLEMEYKKLITEKPDIPMLDE